MENPFKFGSIVQGEYFTNRVKEIGEITNVISSKNHLILISPRRFGKTSLIKKVLTETNHKQVFLNLQAYNSPEEFASKLLSEIYKNFSIQKLTDYIKGFRIVPSVNINPVSQDISVSFTQSGKKQIILEDVFNLLEKLSAKKKVICVFDEFQDIFRIDKSLDRILRTIMQGHQNVNYIFLGSEESMMKYIFEDVKSPFYHFGYLMNLSPISEDDFKNFISNRFKHSKVGILPEQIIEILGFTKSHPFYTQQLAFNVWNNIVLTENNKNKVIETIEQVVQKHDNDYERLWQNLNNTDRKLLKGLALLEMSPMTSEFGVYSGLRSTSTVLSSLKRLIQRSYLIKVDGKYTIEDPFFSIWIKGFTR
ncbi:MAG: ATP-binding protein [Bacteroidales bacterium]|nr:ATP-binding protein [Bacteroidales bacterium]